MDQLNTYWGIIAYPIQLITGDEINDSHWKQGDKSDEVEAPLHDAVLTP